LAEQLDGDGGSLTYLRRSSLIVLNFIELIYPALKGGE
jgi:hypothetical protein